MTKYLETIERMCRDSVTFCVLTLIAGSCALTLFALSGIATKGLTLLAALILWGYIVYKEANKDET